MMPDSTPPRLSLCMIVRNEIADLPICLHSVRGLAEETIVVDTGSTDGTPAIARELGATVIATEWADDFSAARNLGLAKARGAWILVLDADESLTPESTASIRALIAREPVEAYSLVTRSTDRSSGQHTRGEIVRIFPNRSDVRYAFPIHEAVNRSLVQAKIPIRPTGIEIIHSGYATSEELSHKANRNRKIIEEALQKNPAHELDLHLRYYYASAFYDANDPARAAAEFELCLKKIGTQDAKLAKIARLRAAECHFLTGDAARALDYLPARLEDSLHPAALCLRSEIEALQGRPDAAQEWCEALLRAPDGAYAPPVPLGVLKFKALKMLGARWASKGRKDIAVGILKLAVEIQRGARDGARADLADLYRKIVSGRS